MTALTSLALRYDGERLEILDQTQLSQAEIWVNVTEPDAMFRAIQLLQVRGAPLIGVAAALCLGHLTRRGVGEDWFRQTAERLRAARPTAVNLMWAIDRLCGPTSYEPQWITQEAERIFHEDIELCQRIAENGEPLIETGENILTHCNTGGLATAGWGTALGVIRLAHARGKKIHVYVDETRPLLQGGRLTTWELEKLGIPYTLICDNMAASLMASGRVQRVIVGADRIAANGDFANKVGTYSLAVICDYHKVPFAVAAPYSTVDLSCPTGQEIPIEQRAPGEVRGVKSQAGQLEWAPATAAVYNPAFDVTPRQLVAHWVLDRGLFNQQQIATGALSSTAGRQPG